MRGQARITWVKLHVTGWLHGSIRWQLEPDERGVWADLIALAGQCMAQGRICDNDGRPFPPQYIANQLNIPLELLERTVCKCKEEGRIQDRDGTLVLSNWTYYQSEYERQKPYRDRRRSADPDKHGGSYGSLAARTQEDVDGLKALREAREAREVESEAGKQE